MRKSPTMQFKCQFIYHRHEFLIISHLVHSFSTGNPSIFRFFFYFHKGERSLVRNHYIYLFINNNNKHHCTHHLNLMKSCRIEIADCVWFLFSFSYHQNSIELEINCNTTINCSKCQYIYNLTCVSVNGPINLQRLN